MTSARDIGASEAFRNRSPEAANAARRWPLQAYFGALVAVFVLAAAAATIYVRVQTGHDSRSDASRDAQFAASTAAHQLAENIRGLKEAVQSLATNPQIAQAVAHPAGCTLSYTGNGPADRSHLDILRSNGDSVCSSRQLPAGGSFTGYEAANWLRRARSAAVLVAPIRDPATGKDVAITSVPIPGHGMVAGFFDLTNAGPYLASLYGGGRPVEFLVTSRDSRTILARSIDSTRWVGKPSAGTPFAHASGRLERRDVDGKERYYRQATVAGTGWHFYAGEDKGAALAAGDRLEHRQLLIILLGLAGALVAALLVYRRVAHPIVELREAVQGARQVGSPALVPAKGPAEVAGLATDVNDLMSSVSRELVSRTHAEEALRRSEESYRLLFDRHPAPMWLFDPETLGFLAVNDTAIATYGYTREEFLSMTIEQIRPPEEQAALRAAVGALERGRVEAGIWRHIKKDGTVIQAEVLSHDTEFEGRPARLVLANDVTERRQLEEQLRQSQKMEAVGNLAGGIAHDFNNILMVIRTTAALLQRKLTDEGALADAQQIDRAAERAADLTHQLLAFSRRQVLQPEVTDLNSVVEDTLELLRRLIGENIEIACELAPDLPAIVVDQGQLNQVILNLAVNARDAMPNGGKLTIRTANAQLDDSYVSTHLDVTIGEYVVLQVTDSGAGMSEETRDHIFDPFFTTKETGTGLGLATVYGIVSQSGGHIWVYSEPGLGTTFKLYFPSARAEAAIPPAPEVTSLVGDETILLVEDEEVLRPLIREALESYGYRVLEAAEGNQALELAEQAQGELALVITDVVMPGMNGRELADRLAERHPTLKVLFTSGYPADTLVLQGVAEGTVAYIEKPYLPDDLARKIRALLEA